MTDSDPKLCRLVTEFSRVCERRKLRVNVSKCKVMRCSRYVNGGRMHGRLNGEPFEEMAQDGAQLNFIVMFSMN